MTITTDSSRIAAYDRFKEDIASGRTFHFASQSFRSADRMGYYPMMQNQRFSDVVVALGKAAGMGDFYADAVSKALRHINPAQNDYMMAWGIADAFAEFIREEWTDTRQKSGPEAGRPSSWTHTASFHQIVMLNLILNEVYFSLHLGSVPGIGWVLRQVVEEEGIRVHQMYLPNVAKSL